MQCLACGAKMHPGEALGKDSAPGFEHRTFTCSVCGDVERRLVLKRHVTPTNADPVLFPDAPPISPLAPIENESTAASVFTQRLFAKLYGIRNVVRRRKKPPFTSVSVNPQESAHTAEAVPETPLSEPIPELTPASLNQIEPETVQELPPLSMPAQTDENKEECESLLRNAIAIVKSATRSSEKAPPLIELRSATPASTSAPGMIQTSCIAIDEKSPAVVQTRSIPAERKSPVIVVQILYDAHKAKYVAKDTKSGLGVLRHQDSARLRAMCDRLGWQIV
jgi:hypothetical protein